MKTNRFAYLKFALAFFSTVLMTPSDESLAQSVYDVFPLSKNLHYRYQFESRYSYHELLSLMSLSVDSGTVEYVIQDSIHLADSAIVWTVRQSEHLWHRRFVDFSDIDTSYWSDKDTSVFLVERLTGQHALSCSSWVWSFPLTSPSDTIFRYSTAGLFTLTRQYPPPEWMTSTVDTLCFKNLIGLYHRFRDYQFHGISHINSSISISQLGTPTHINNEVSDPPRLLKLYGNYPNPFNGSTRIAYSLASPSSVTLRVFDLLGQEVLTIEVGSQTAGEHSFSVDLHQLSSSVYFYRLWANGEALTSEFVLIR